MDSSVLFPSSDSNQDFSTPPPISLCNKLCIINKCYDQILLHHGSVSRVGLVETAHERALDMLVAILGTGQYSI